MSETTTCEKCGIEYDRYTILYTDDIVTLSVRAEVRQEYANLCRDCFNSEMDTDGYALTDA